GQRRLGSQRGPRRALPRLARAPRAVARPGPPAPRPLRAAAQRRFRALREARHRRRRREERDPRGLAPPLGRDAAQGRAVARSRLRGRDRDGGAPARAQRHRPLPLRRVLARGRAREPLPLHQRHGRRGARVHGESQVFSCERVGAAWRLVTAQGSVRARRVVLCTNDHAGNRFFPELARTQYPLVACSLTTTPLPDRVLRIVNPSRAAMMQHPTGLYPLVLDGRRRLVTSTIPPPGAAQRGDRYFAYFLRFLRRAYPALRDETIALECYWTGMTSNSSSVYREAYPQLFEVAPGVLAL